MTIASTWSKIVSMVAASSGIVTCSASLPAVVNNADLPLAYVTVGPGAWNEHAEGLKRQVRTYTVSVLVKPVALGLYPDEGYQAAMPILNALGNVFLDDPTFGDTIDQLGSGSRPQFTDGGVGVLKFAETDYFGCAMQLQVTEKGT